MIQRKTYLNTILGAFGAPFIKVITGMRRVGKSTILLQIIESLKSNWATSENIFFLDLENFSFEHIKDAQILHETIEQFFVGKNGKKYIFIDEIQDIV